MLSSSATRLHSYGRVVCQITTMGKHVAVGHQEHCLKGTGTAPQRRWCPTSYRDLQFVDVLSPSVHLAGISTPFKMPASTGTRLGSDWEAILDMGRLTVTVVFRLSHLLKTAVRKVCLPLDELFKRPGPAATQCTIHSIQSPLPGSCVFYALIKSVLIPVIALYNDCTYHSIAWRCFPVRSSSCRFWTIRCRSAIEVPSFWAIIGNRNLLSFRFELVDGDYAAMDCA